MMSFDDFVHGVADGIEVAGMAVIVLGIAVAMARFSGDLVGRSDSAYGRVRTRIGRSILLGLEFLVAGDIIATVAIRPTFTSVGVLAIIVVIRTFLSFALETEINGRPPWAAREGR